MRLTSDAGAHLTSMMWETAHANAANGLLAWWRAAGVDTLVADTRKSWLSTLDAVSSISTRDAEPRSARASVNAANRNPVGAPGLARAEALARAADGPAALSAAAREFAGPQALLFDGALDSRLLFVTDAPTAEDAQAAHLFAGTPGKLLDRMLAAIGRDRTRAALATAALLPSGAPALPFLHRLIALARPTALVALGGAATALLTGETRGLNRLRGKWIDIELDGARLPVLPTFHPAHLLDHSGHKALAWADLLTLTTRIDV